MHCIRCDDFSGNDAIVQKCNLFVRIMDMLMFTCYTDTSIRKTLAGLLK